MGLFGGLTDEGLEEAQDRVGGFQPHETDIYKGTIMMAYALKSTGGAQGVYLTVALENGKEYRETLWVTNKKGENFYLNKNDNTKKVPLPGFTVMNDICLVTTEKPLNQQNDEEKVVKVWDSETRSEQPKSVPVLVDLLGKELSVAIGNTLENKTMKQGNDYVVIADTRNVNTIEKVFHEPTKLTVTEGKNGKTEGEFYQTWLDRNKGVVRDKREIKEGQAGTAGRPGQTAAASGPPAAGQTAPRQSLFGNKS